MEASQNPRSENDMSDIKDQIQESLDKIRPYLQADGGDVEFVELSEDGKVVQVRLQGACGGCPGATMTLKMGIERALRRDVPGVETVEAVN
jgi:Fe-S cluster biogenesis protein NfuA